MDDAPLRVTVMHKLPSICINGGQQQACNQTVAHLRASSLLHCVLRSPSCVLTNEIVLNVTIASSDSQSSGASLLDFVEKLIHRFVEDKKRLRVT